MKRILAIALSTLALGANAQGLPQPSFMDYVPLEPGAGQASAGSSAPALSRAGLPQPSFIDYVAIDSDASSVRSGAMLSRHELPQPSFVDYPARDTASATASWERPVLAGTR
jgi:hypothetical protein